jgi:hypothetical protein
MLAVIDMAGRFLFRCPRLRRMRGRTQPGTRSAAAMGRAVSPDCMKLEQTPEAAEKETWSALRLI